MIRSTKSPSKSQFVVALTTTSPIAYVNLDRDVLSTESATSRIFSNAFYIRLAGFTTNSDDILNSKHLTLINVKLLDSEALFPLLYNAPTSSADIYLSIDMAINRSTLGKMSIEALDLPATTSVNLLFDIDTV